MQIYNKQQQAIILKGIAQQILSMNVPTFNEVDKLLKEFNQTLYPVDIIEELHTDRFFFKQLVEDTREAIYSSYPSVAEWIDDSIKEHEESQKI